MALAEERALTEKQGNKYLAKFESAWYSPPTETVMKFIPLARKYLSTGETKQIKEYLKEKSFIDTGIDRLSKKCPIGKTFNLNGKKATVSGYKYNPNTKKFEVQFND